MPRARHLHLLVGLLLLVGLVALRLGDPAPLRELRALQFDQFQRLAPRPDADLPVRVIDIDEASLARIGQWPWPRDRFAAMVDRLADLDVAAIGFGVIFAEPDRLSPARLAEALGLVGDLPAGAGPLPDHDRRLAAAMRGRGIVLGTAALPSGGAPAPAGRSGFVEIGAEPGAGLPQGRAFTPVLPILAEASAGIGSLGTSPRDGAGTIRSLPLLWRTEAGVLPALALEVLRVALGETTYVLMGAAAERGVSEAVRIGAFEIPTTSGGELLLHFRRDDPARHVPAHALLADPPDPALADALAGTIVLVGTSAPGIAALQRTPLGQTVPGIAIHAQALELILAGAFLRRPPTLDALEVLGLVAVGLLAGGAVVALAPLPAALAAVGLALLVVGGSLHAFLVHRLLVDATVPLLGGLAMFTVMTVLRHAVADRERRGMRRAFSQYVSREVLDAIERSGHRPRLGGDIRTVTVMFADIRDYTARSERMGATEVVALLNEIFSDLGDAVLAEQGTIDKFIGDGMMAFWNAPLSAADHRLRACRGALRMRAALQAFNVRRGWTGAEAVALAIGLNTGSACVGNIGSRSRFNYSVIGDTVNAAARIETACRHVGYDILLSATVAEEAGVAGLALLPAGALVVRGRAERLATHLLVGDAALAASPPFAALAAAHAALVAALAAAADVEAQLARCLGLCGAVDARLEEFYRRLPARSGDFRAPPPAAPVA